MKRLLSLLLMLCLLAGLSVPQASAAQEKEIPYALLERAASQLSPETDFSEAPAKRTTSYSYGIPAPLAEGQATVLGNNMPLRYILVENGVTPQMLYCAVYQGDSSILDDPNFDEEPVATARRYFSAKSNMCEHTFNWDTDGAELGTYTVISFTVANNSQIISETAAYVEVEVVSSERPLTGLTFTDLQSGEVLSEINLVFGEQRVIVIGRTPVPTTDLNDFTISGLSAAEEYHGLLYLYGDALGRGTLNVKTKTQEFKIRVNVCSSAEGHQYRSEEFPRTGATANGSVLYTCKNCGYCYSEVQSSRTEIFEAFRDVAEGAWYYDEVHSAVLRGLFNGVSTERFGPEITMNRAMLVTVLWRYAGEPSASAEPSFTDVPSGRFYTKAVAWAAENGIVNGVGNGKFDPEGIVTREQMATILYRYANNVGADTTARGDLSSFTDADQVGNFALEAMRWTVAEGIIGGSKSQGQLYLLPKDGATRAQVAAILVRAIDKLFAEEYYVIALPEGEVKAAGSVSLYDWTLYEDGTLTLAARETVAENAVSWSEYTQEIVCVKVMQGVSCVTDDLFADHTALKTVELADSVTKIGQEAFQNCTALTEVRIPDSLVVIDTCAFYGCSALSAIDLPSNLCRLGASAFENCTALLEIELPDGNIYQKYGNRTGSYGAFANCTSLQKVTLGRGNVSVPYDMFHGCTALTTVEFAEGVGVVNESAFEGCTALTELVLPASVYKIDVSSFEECTNLQKVTIFNPYLNLTTPYTDGSGEEHYSPPFPEGCVVCGYEGTMAQVYAEYYGYTFEAIAE